MNILSQTSQNITCEPQVQIPDSYIDAFKECCGRGAQAMTEFVRALWGALDFATVFDLAGRNEARERKFRRVLNEYGGERLVAAKGQMDQVNTNTEAAKETEGTSVSSDPKQQAAEKPAMLYRLRRSELSKIILEEFIKPHLADKNNICRLDVHDLEAWNIEGDEILIADFNRHVEAAMDDDQRQEMHYRRKIFFEEYASWKQRLADPSCAELPTHPQGMDISQDIILSAVAKVSIPALGTVQRWKELEAATGYSRGAIRRAEHKLGIKREAHFSESRQIVRPGQPLPPPDEWSPAYGGCPHEFVTDSGEFLNPRNPTDLAKAQAALDQGESLIVSFVDGTVAGWMTEVEQAAQKRDKPANKRSTFARPSTPTPEYVGTRSMRRVLDILRDAETICKLPFMPDLTVIQRIYRVAGREYPTTGDSLIDFCLDELGATSYEVAAR